MNISIFQEHCCGCGECFASCPFDAISMKPNRQGFCYPEVDLNKCKGCSICVESCSYNKDRGHKNTVLSAYAVKHVCGEVRALSRSGGVFTALSDVILHKRGSIYGCRLIGNDEAVHERAITQEGRDAFRGSKYIQSDIKDAFYQVADDLKNGKWVLFSGTPCQVSAVADYCKNYDTSKLILVDVVCHGVPSKRVWKDYLKYIARTKKKAIVGVDFRDKHRFGWSAHRETFSFSDGTTYSDSIFRKLFYAHYILRRDCFSCPYKNLNRAGDITIADCWGITDHYPEFDDNQGVSLVLINSDKGRKIYNQIDDVVQIEVELNKVMQACLEKNWIIPEEYEPFWKYYTNHTFRQVIDRYVDKKEHILIRGKNRVKEIGSKLKRILTER